jgi:hypothetical protein
MKIDSSASRLRQMANKILLPQPDYFSFKLHFKLPITNPNHQPGLGDSQLLLTIILQLLVQF